MNKQTTFTGEKGFWEFNGTFQDYKLFSSISKLDVSDSQKQNLKDMFSASSEDRELACMLIREILAS